MKVRTWVSIAGLALGLTGAPAGAHDLRSAVAAYRHGDYGLTLSILKPMAHDGDPYAQYGLGVLFDNGQGVPENYEHALKWYLKAAEHGLADAQYMAGMHYAAGRGRPQEPARAYFWFNLAAAAGVPHAERARDQEEAVLSRGDRKTVQGLSSRWLKKRRAQFACAPRNCIHPNWIDKPEYSVFDTLN